MESTRPNNSTLVAIPPNPEFYYTDDYVICVDDKQEILPSDGCCSKIDWGACFVLVAVSTLCLVVMSIIIGYGLSYFLT